MKIKKAAQAGTLLALFYFTVSADVLHVERFLEGGKNFVRVLVPEIYQTDAGIHVFSAIARDSGPTFVNEWFVTEHTVPFPVIAIHQREDLPIWTGEAVRPEGTLLFEGARDYFDSGEPAFPNAFDYQRNGGWVASSTLNLINISQYPWTYQDQLGWTYLMQAEPTWHGMAWWGYSVQEGWLFIAEAYPGNFYAFASGGWTQLK